VNHALAITASTLKEQKHVQADAVTAHNIEFEAKLDASDFSNKFQNFTNIAREIVGNREVVATIKEEDEQEDHPKVNVFAAAYVGKEKTPYYSKIIDNIWEFQLFG